MSAGDVDPEGVQILSTEGMIKRPALSRGDEFIVATEVGILHRLRRENPSKRFFAANERASCAYMKVTTLPKVQRALEHDGASHHGAGGRREPGSARDRADDRHRRAEAAEPRSRPRSIPANSRARNRTESEKHGNASGTSPSARRRRARSRRSARRRSAEMRTAPLSYNQDELRDLVRSALDEDEAFNDLTTIATVVSDRHARGQLVARANGRGLRRAARRRGVPPARSEGHDPRRPRGRRAASARATRSCISPAMRAPCSPPSASRSTSCSGSRGSRRSRRGTSTR